MVVIFQVHRSRDVIRHVTIRFPTGYFLFAPSVNFSRPYVAYLVRSRICYIVASVVVCHLSSSLTYVMWLNGAS